MTDSEIEMQILARNHLRELAQLPALDAHERVRLRSARANRVFERCFAAQRGRFDTRVETGEGWSRGFGKWIRARQQVRNELQHGKHLQYALEELGFTAASDQADAGGRRNYVCSSAATPLTMADLTSFLAGYGWERDEDRPSRFVNRRTSAILEVETGGSAIAVAHDEAASS